MSSELTTRTKKAKGKTVSSRYLQSAEKYSSDSASSGTTKAQTIWRKNETRLEKNNKPILNKVSTPQSHAALLSFNASAIPRTSSLNTLRKDNLRQSSLTRTGLKKCEPNRPLNLMSTGLKKYEPKKQSNTLLTNASVIPNKIAENQATKDLEDDIDICYSQYLLAVLMENKAKNSLKSRSSFALEKFYEVYQYVGLLLENHGNLERGLSLASYLLKLHEHLQKQEKTLLPILESIPTFESQYEEIAIAADSVRHKLHTKDIDLPTDGYQGEIIQLMEKVITLLEQILQITNNVEEIISTAESTKCFVNRGKAIAEEIKRASEQLSESRDLLLSETSLKFASLTMEDV